MSIHDCCGTTCDRESVIEELRQLREFKARTLALLSAGDDNRVPMGQTAGSGVSQLIHNGEPVLITNWKAPAAYLLPDAMVRELLLGGE